MLDVGQLTPERRDALIEKLSAFVVRRRFEMPVVFMLEAGRPLTFLGSQGLVVGQPILASLFGWERIDEFRLLLEDRQNVDRLISAIETGAEARDRTPQPTGPAEEPRA